jgi:hypothetical protein
VLLDAIRSRVKAHQLAGAHDVDVEDCYLVGTKPVADNPRGGLRPDPRELPQEFSKNPR